MIPALSTTRCCCLGPPESWQMQMRLHCECLPVAFCLVLTRGGMANCWRTWKMGSAKVMTCVQTPCSKPTHASCTGSMTRRISFTCSLRALMMVWPLPMLGLRISQLDMAVMVEAALGGKSSATAATSRVMWLELAWQRQTQQPTLVQRQRPAW